MTGEYHIGIPLDELTDTQLEEWQRQCEERVAFAERALHSYDSEWIRVEAEVDRRAKSRQAAHAAPLVSIDDDDSPF